MSESRWNGWQDDAETGGSANLSKDGSEALYSQNPASDRQACNGNHMHFWSDGSYSQKSDGRNVGGINEDVGTAVTAFLGGNSDSSNSSSGDSDGGSFNLFDPSTW